MLPNLQRDGVHHCDLKPANFIKLDRGGRKEIRVIDLEMCTTDDEVEVSSQGTVGFKAPLDECRYWCFAADVYGVMQTLSFLVRGDSLEFGLFMVMVGLGYGKLPSSIIHLISRTSERANESGVWEWGANQWRI